MLPAVVLAGGLGTRIVEVTGGAVPKVLVPVDGRPFLDVKLLDLAAQGVPAVFLLTGHQSDQIESHLAAASIPIPVTCIPDGPELRGTGGALRAASDRLPERYVLTYGDSYLPIDLAAVVAAAATEGTEGLMTIKRNHDVGGPSNVRFDDATARVVAYVREPDPGSCDWIDYGLQVLSRDAVDRLPSDGAFGLGELWDSLIARRQLAGLEVVEDFYEVGTPGRLEATTTYLRERRVWDRLRAATAPGLGRPR